VKTRTTRTVASEAESVTVATVASAPTATMTPLDHDRLMNTPNTDSMSWHPASGRVVRRRTGDAEIVDLATERAVRLLAQAGMIHSSAVSKRSRTVR
jgi:hypothetical protein